MTLAPLWRTRLYAAVGGLLAVWMGFAVAQEELAWPFFLTAAVLGLVLMKAQPMPVGAVLLGAILVGYVVGNRGFAQLYLSNWLPLLPAELVLLAGGVIMIIECAARQQLPVRRDALNLALCLWMLAGTVRMFFDVRAYGFPALRDYALVYYGGFFFLAQYAARDPAVLRFLYACLLAGCGLLLFVHPLVQAFPLFFWNALSIRGVPLIYYKDDLAGNFMALGSLLFFIQFERSRKWWSLALCLALAAVMLTTNSRSSMVGLGVGALWLGLGGRWRYMILLGASGVAVVIAILSVAYFRDQSWRQTPLNSVYERAVSMVDPHGQHSYQEADTLSKGDNNVFRLVWWRIAIEECLEKNPWFGLGFGYDLAERFIREYLPEGSEEFSARSPHNVVITVFSRMGAIGCGTFLFLIGVVAVRTWRTLHRAVGDNLLVAMWAGAWVIFACACFGVVLEGPMGAVVFWSLLGLASGAETPVGPEVAPALQPAESSDAMAIAS